MQQAGEQDRAVRPTLEIATKGCASDWSQKLETKSPTKELSSPGKIFQELSDHDEHAHESAGRNKSHPERPEMATIESLRELEGGRESSVWEMAG